MGSVALRDRSGVASAESPVKFFRCNKTNQTDPQTTVNRVSRPSNSGISMDSSLLGDDAFLWEVLARTELTHTRAPCKGGIVRDTAEGTDERCQTDATGPYVNPMIRSRGTGETLRPPTFTGGWSYGWEPSTS